VALFCGIDWAETQHDVAIIDDDGQLVAKKRIADGPSGSTELIEMHTAAGDFADTTVPVAIEMKYSFLAARWEEMKLARGNGLSECQYLVIPALSDLPLPI
jgi:hypothetical protein